MELKELLSNLDTYQIVDGEKIAKINLNVNIALLFTNADKVDLKCILQNYFDDKIFLWAEQADGFETVSLGDFTKSSTVLLYPQSFLTKKRFSYEDALEILTFLRSPNGCPWDRVQTHESIRSNIIEEAYELVDAINSKDKTKMVEEIGDLMLQGMFNILMAKEKKKFDENDVFSELCTKLITRHTHIFGQDKVTTDAEALSVWDANKLTEKHIQSHTQNLKEVPNNMSALMRAFKVQKRASKVGFDWEKTDDVVDKCLEEVSEVLQSVKQKDKVHTEKELGDLLFAIVNLCRFLDVAPEVALAGTTNRFINRFEYVDNALKSNGTDMTESDLQTMDKLWQEAKEVLNDR